MNCSGKHAAMLATCVANGWPTADLPRRRPPAAAGDRRHVRADDRGAVAHVAVDGCGAPLLSTSLTGLARAFSRARDGRPRRRRRAIAEAIRAHPEYVSGTHRDELTLLRAIPGAIGKAGAESCYVVALPDGRAFATKTDDGAARARPVLMAALLERLGVTEEPGWTATRCVVRASRCCSVAGSPVGEIRASYWRWSRRCCLLASTSNIHLSS